jgi:aminotransferase
MTSSKIVEELLKKEKVCSTAGSVFGSFGENHIRFSYATSVEIILKAMEKLREFVEKIN